MGGILLIPRLRPKRRDGTGPKRPGAAQRTAAGQPPDDATTGRESRDVEFRLLAAFVRHPGQLLSHDQVLELVWGDSFGASRDQVKLYVGYLRRKLEGEGPKLIHTIRGVGYTLRSS